MSSQHKIDLQYHSQSPNLDWKTRVRDGARRCGGGAMLGWAVASSTALLLLLVFELVRYTNQDQFVVRALVQVFS